MKNKFIISVITSSLFGVSASVLAADPVTVTGGTIHFDGRVVSAACSVAAGSRDQTVILDQVRTAKLATAGVRANQKKGFDIVLEDCDISVSSNASVTFNGQEDPTVSGTLQNTAGAGAAGNVALELYGKDGKALALGVASPTMTLIDGENTLPFSVDYLATGGAASAGAVKSTATFNITYS